MYKLILYVSSLQSTRSRETWNGGSCSPHHCCIPSSCFLHWIPILQALFFAFCALVAFGAVQRSLLVVSFHPPFSFYPFHFWGFQISNNIIKFKKTSVDQILGFPLGCATLQVLLFLGYFFFMLHQKRRVGRRKGVGPKTNQSKTNGIRENTSKKKDFILHPSLVAAGCCKPSGCAFHVVRSSELSSTQPCRRSLLTPPWHVANDHVHSIHHCHIWAPSLPGRAMDQVDLETTDARRRISDPEIR